jgi:winged helix-turn-helix protein DUF2582
MNSERIGQAAGAIWTRLHAKGATGLSLTEMKKVPGFSADEALLGIGWLAREGKLSFQTEGKKAMVKLVQEECFA